MSLQGLNAGNASFSQALPGLQLAIDSTSLGEFKTCPRKYFYSTVLGIAPQGESPHLTFGLWLHQAREKYDKRRAQDAKISHDEILDEVLDWVLKVTWDRELGRPWISSEPTKTRVTLVQTVVWYLDALAQNDPLETIQFADGSPAIELSFRFLPGFTAKSTGEAFVFCGHLDRIAKMNSVPYIVDIKTTKSQLGSFWLAEFTPGNQFSMYALAGRVAFSEPVQAVIVDGIQVGVGFARFHRGIAPRTEEGLEEWLAGAGHWLDQMEQAALAKNWPMNETSCSKYGGCPYRELCSKRPSERKALVERLYRPRVWDPIQSRRDI